MTIKLNTKPGINGANTLSIPTEWDAAWFRKFIANSLKGADVRNAVGANGITVTGTIASPYATISGGGPTTFTAPIVINSTAGQVSLTVNGASGQSAAVFNGPVVINDSFGPFGLTVNGDGTDVTMQLNTPSGRFSGLYMQKAGVTEAELFFDATTNSLTLSYDIASSSFRLRSPSAIVLTASSAGNVTIAAPSSGTALTVSGLSNVVSTEVTANEGRLRITATAASGKAYEWISGGGNALAAGLFGLFDVARGASPFTVGASGNFTIAAPSSGDTLTVAPSATTGALIATSAALTNNAGALVGTLTNSPATGNPTKWIKINDNGTIRSIPSW